MKRKPAGHSFRGPRGTGAVLLGVRVRVPEGGQESVGPGDSFTNLVAGAGVRREGPSDPAH